jgi:hypothetical protein
MEWYVAKSYQDWKRECEPFEANGKMYITVRNPKGTTKNVRAYTEKEYRKMYPAEAPSMTEPRASGPVVKNILGFQDGYIWIFKGDLEYAEYWFEKTKEARFHVIIGWYIASTDAVPFDIPCCIESVKLPWEKVGNTDGTLLPKDIVAAAVNEIRYGGHPSTHQGHIGDRLDLTLYVTRILNLGDTQYGTKYMYIFEDKEENVYTWTTGVNKTWLVGNAVHVRGSVKSHEVYQGVQQTNLTRVNEVK